MAYSRAARRRGLFDFELAQVGLGQLDQFFAAAGQDGPGRVQGEALDLAVGELGRQGQLGGRPA